MEQIREIVLRWWKAIRSFLFSWDALTFLFFVLAAAVMWYGHAISTEREATLHVPVRYAGIPHDVHFEPDLPDQVDVTIRDAGRRLIAQSEDIPVLTFDLSDQIKGSTGKIHIAQEQIIQKLPTSLQGSGTTKMLSISPEYIEGAYTERYTERKFTLPVETRKVPSGYKLVIFPTMVEVIVRVSQSHYNDISAKDLTIYCEYPTSGEDKLAVKHIHRSKYIKGVRFEPTELEYIIEKQ